MQPMSTQRQIFYSFHQDALSINVRPNKNGGVTDERACKSRLRSFLPRSIGRAILSAPSLSMALRDQSRLADLLPLRYADLVT
jgi:hypothetical protein